MGVAKPVLRGGGAPTLARSTEDAAGDVAVQKDGRLVVVGRTVRGAAGGVGVVRYLANGTLDPSFGAGGRVVIDVGARGEGTSVAVQRDGRIVIVGASP